MIKPLDFKFFDTKTNEFIEWCVLSDNKIYKTHRDFEDWIESKTIIICVNIS